MQTQPQATICYRVQRFIALDRLSWLSHIKIVDGSMPSQVSQSLLDLLQENGGKLGNLSARRLLREKLGCSISEQVYERSKEQLLSLGLIRRAPGRGGAIELLSINQNDPSTSSSPETKEQLSQKRIDDLYTSLYYTPGLWAKRNKVTITILCGDDNDKLYCGWNIKKSAYFIQYRLEKGRSDNTELVEQLFKKASQNIPNSTIQRISTSTTLNLGKSVPQVNHVVRVLMNDLEDITLDPDAKDRQSQKNPRQENYFLDIAKLIKLSTENNLQWPLTKNWRQALGFDDVDDLIVIGSSPLAVSARNNKETYREHVVPVSIIKREAEKLALMGAPEQVIADFIEHHLYVVIITRQEADLLDKPIDQSGLSLKTSMPEGWVFGDDPLARLRQAGININFLNPIPLPKWKPWRKPGLRDRIRKILNTPLIKV